MVYEPKVVAADELRGEIILYVLCRPALLRTYGPHRFPAEQERLLKERRATTPVRRTSLLRAVNTRLREVSAKLGAADRVALAAVADHSIE